MNDSDKERNTITFSHLFDLVHKGPKERSRRKTEEIRNLFLRFFKELVGSNHSAGLGKVLHSRHGIRDCAWKGNKSEAEPLKVETQDC